MECEYTIATGDLKASISVLVQEINIEYSRGCIYDSLMVQAVSCLYAKAYWLRITNLG